MKYFYLLLLTFVLLTGCSQSDTPYTAYNEKTGVTSITNKGKSFAKNLSNEKLDKEIPALLYAYQFDIEEVRNLQMHSVGNDSTFLYFFEDLDGDSYCLYNGASEVKLKELKFTLADQEAMDKLITSNPIKEKKLQPLIDLYLLYSHGTLDKDFTFLGFNQSSEGDVATLSINLIVDSTPTTLTFTQGISAFTHKAILSDTKEPDAPLEISLEQALLDAKSYFDDYANREGLDVIDVQVCYATKDAVPDYIGLVAPSDGNWEGTLLLIDGKDLSLLASTHVYIGIAYVTLDVKTLADGEGVVMEVFASGDSPPVSSLFYYNARSLKPLDNSLLPLPEAYWNGSMWQIYDASANLTHTITPTDLTSLPSLSKTVPNDELSYNTVTALQEDGRIRVTHSIICYAVTGEEILEIQQDYLYNSTLDTFEPSPMTLTAYDGYKTASLSGNTIGAAAPTPSWYSNGVLALSKDDLTSFFSTSVDELITLFGEPYSISGDTYWYDMPGINFTFGAENAALSGLVVYGNTHQIFGTHRGMLLSDVKTILGQPLAEGLGELDDLYYLYYVIDGRGLFVHSADNKVVDSYLLKYVE